MAGLKFAMDIGSSKITLFAFLHGQTNPIIVANSTKLYDGFIDGEFLEPSQLADVVQELMSDLSTKLKYKIKKVYVGVPSEFCLCVCKRKTRKFLKPIKIKLNLVRELFDGLEDYKDGKGYRIISASPMQYVLDSEFKTLNPENKKSSQIVLDGSYILAKQDFLNKFDNILHHLGVKEIEYVPTILGQALLCNEQDPLSPKAIVDVGHITTSVAIAKGEGLALLSSFSLGGGHITADIMQLFQKSFKDSELIKRKVALTLKPNKDDKYIIQNGKEIVSSHIQITNDVVRSRIENIAHIVDNILDIDESFKDIPIYITGDGVCNFKGAINIFEKLCNRPINEFKLPFDNTEEKFQTSKRGLIEIVSKLAD